MTGAVTPSFAWLPTLSLPILTSDGKCELNMFKYNFVPCTRSDGSKHKDTSCTSDNVAYTNPSSWASRSLTSEQLAIVPAKSIWVYATITFQPDLDDRFYVYNDDEKYRFMQNTIQTMLSATENMGTHASCEIDDTMTP